MMASQLWAYSSGERGIQEIEWLYLQVTNTGCSALLGHPTASTWLQGAKMATLLYGIQTPGCKWGGPCWGTRNGSRHSAGNHITGECPANAESTCIQSSENTRLNYLSFVADSIQWELFQELRDCHSVMSYSIVTWHRYAAAGKHITIPGPLLVSGCHSHRRTVESGVLCNICAEIL